MELALAALMFRRLAQAFLQGWLSLLLLQTDLAGAHVQLFKDVGRERGLVWQLLVGCLFLRLVTVACDSGSVRHHDFI